MKKNTLKQSLLTVMVLVASAALCACGGGKKTESSETGNNSSETTAESVADTAEAAAAGEGATTDGADPARFVFGITQEITSVDPHNDTDAATRSVLFNVFDGLVKATPEGEVVPAVASDYTVSDDATVYTFTVRDGITFTDGNAITAEDIKYSLERFAELNEGSALSVITDITAVDDKTVQITLAAPDSEFIYNMTIAILEKANDANQVNAPIGTGAFSIVELKEGQYLELTKYADYWNAAELGNYVDEVRFKFIADAQTAFMELQSGTIDGLQYLTIDQINALSDTYDVVETTMNLVHGMFLNNKYEPLANEKVRQALNYAVNRDEINEFIFGGKSPIIQTHAYQATSWYNEATASTYTYDPEKAKELLAEAGYEGGFDLEITVPSNFDQHVSTAEIITEQLKAVGINATINKVEWSTWLDEVYKNRKYEATVIGFDASVMAPYTWYKRYVSDSDNDMTNFSDPTYDELYAKAVATIDFDEKHEIYNQMQQILAEKAASVFIEDPADFVAINKKYTGYTPYPVSAIDMSRVQVVK